MKKIISIIAALALLLSVTAAAWAVDYTPTNIERRSVDGSEYIVKTYELPPEADPPSLIELEFEDGGLVFSHYTTTSEEQATDL